MSRRAGLALLLVAGMAACGDSGGSVERQAASNLRPGDPVPDYGALTLEGDPVRLADLAGEVVLLNVWATWCAPCRREIPELETLHQAHADDGLRVVGVSVDSRAARDQVLRFIDDMGMTYDVWLDPSLSVIDALGVVGVPFTVLIDRNGRVAWTRLGPLLPEDPGLTAAVDSLLSI